MLEFDDEMAQRVEALYRTVDAMRRRAAVLRALEPAPGERVVDIGTGPGFFALDVADRVGPTGEVLGFDISEAMLRLARQRCASRPQVKLELSDATKLPLSDNSVDVAVSIQVYEYVAAVEAALSEMYRVLRPGGRGAIVATDWKTVVWNSSDSQLMNRILAAFSEHCAHQDLPRRLAPMLRSSGFNVVRQSVLPQFNPTYDPDTYSAQLIGAVSSFVAGRGGVTADEAAAWARDVHRTGELGDYFFCVNQYLFSVEKPAAAD